MESILEHERITADGTRLIEYVEPVPRHTAFSDAFLREIGQDRFVLHNGVLTLVFDNGTLPYRLGPHDEEHYLTPGELIENA